MSSSSDSRDYKLIKKRRHESVKKFRKKQIKRSSSSGSSLTSNMADAIDKNWNTKCSRYIEKNIQFYDTQDSSMYIDPQPAIIKSTSSISSSRSYGFIDEEQCDISYKSNESDKSDNILSDSRSSSSSNHNFLLNTKEEFI